MGKEKKKENNNKNKTKPKLEKSPRTKCFLFLFYVCSYTKFHENQSINEKIDSETRWSP